MPQELDENTDCRLMWEVSKVAPSHLVNSVLRTKFYCNKSFLFCFIV